MSELQTLAVHLPNWVGDVVMALPALAHLRDRGSSLHCFGKPWARELIEPFPDRFGVVSGTFLEDARRFRRAGTESGLVFANSLASAVAMRAAGIKAVGYDRRGRGALLGHAIPWRHRPTHEVDAFVQLARALGEDDPRPQALEPRLPLTGSQRSLGQAALRRNDVVSPYVVLAPFSAGRVRGESKCWSAFPQLAQHVRLLGLPVVVCPGPGEEEPCRRLGQDVRVLPGLGLGAYAAVLAEARLVVANDSGPMHLAAAVGSPVLGLYGVTDPARTAPRGRSARTLGAPGCWPTVETVLDVVTRRLSESVSRSRGEPCVP